MLFECYLSGKESVGRPNCYCNYLVAFLAEQQGRPRASFGIGKKNFGKKERTKKTKHEVRRPYLTRSD